MSVNVPAVRRVGRVVVVPVEQRRRPGTVRDQIVTSGASVQRDTSSRVVAGSLIPRGEGTGDGSSARVTTRAAGRR